MNPNCLLLAGDMQDLQELDGLVRYSLGCFKIRGGPHSALFSS
jgi:hypothetical protein